jgi:cytochrome c553
LLSLTGVLAACGGGGEAGGDAAAGSTATEMARPSAADSTLVKTASTSTGTTTATAAAVTAVPTGRLLASNCFSCHGTDGHPSGGFDSLAGKSASEIVSKLKEFQAKPDGGIMRVHALGYTDQQMWELGTYYASLR